MKTIFLILAVALLSVEVGFSTTHTIINSGFTFSPNNLTINLGDTVNFVLGSIHNAREVSQATWNANGNTSNGGFDTPFGGGIVVLQQVGTHYYVCIPHASLGMKGIITVNPATDVHISNENMPAVYALDQNYPNPFNPSTKIRFTIPQTNYVSLKVYNLLGQEVATLVNEVKKAGSYEVEFNASTLSSGIYFDKIVSNDFTSTKKLTLLK